MNRLILLLLWAIWLPCAHAQRAPVAVIPIQGVIGPATADHVHRGLKRAAAQGAQLAVLTIDTPGGLDLSMRAIIRDIIASPMPVASFVAPGGARAASAGTFILYASHIAAMARATNLGAATPVAIGLTGATGAADEKSRPSSGGSPKAGDENTRTGVSGTLERKQVNDAAAYIRGLAQLRGRNADWAEQAVREGASLSAGEALKLKVIDLIAADVPALLKQVNGRKLVLADSTRSLATEGAPITTYEMDWRTNLLSAITDPSVAYILIVVGFLALIFEMSNPGLVVPGVIGAICILIALYAFQMLPVNYTGLALVALGVGLMVAEHFAPGLGILGIGGLIAFVVGSIMLIDTDSPEFRIPWPLIGTVAAAGALFLLGVLNLAGRARARPSVSGRDAMLGLTGEVLAAVSGTSYARVHSELWNVRATMPLKSGQTVRVTGSDGLVLSVEPVQQGETK